MTQFPSASTSLQFDPRSNVGEVNSSRRENQSNLGSAEDSRFSQALDDSSARSDVSRDDAQASAREGSPQENNVRDDRAENAVSQSTDNQSIDAEFGADNAETENPEEAIANEQSTTDQSETALTNIPALFDSFSLLQQVAPEATQTDSITASVETDLLASTSIAGSLLGGEIAGGTVTTPQQNLNATLLTTPATTQTGQLGLASQLGQANPNLLAQANNAANNLAGSVSGETFETALTTQLGNAGSQSVLSSLQSTQLGDVSQQSTNASAGLNLTSTEGEQFGSLSNANQSTATPSQQLASLLSGGSSADAALPNQGQLASASQLTNGQLPQAIQPAVQQAAQPLAQFANAAFANDTLPAFTAQISRNFAAGQDSFNVRINPSELGRVDVRLITNDDGSVNTQIRVERPETLDLFQRDIRALERTLQQSGIKLGSEGIDLSLKDNGADQGGNNQAFNNDFDGQGEHAQNSDPALEADDTNQHLNNDGLLVDDLTGDIPLDQVQTIYARYQPGQLNIRV